MIERVLFVSFLVGLAMAGPLLWLLSLGQQAVGAAVLPTAPHIPTDNPTPTQMPVLRYVAVTGADAGNDCTAASAPCGTVQHAVDTAIAGDVIKVAEGTYSDIHQRSGISQVVHITKSVTLRGGYITANSFAEPPQPPAYTTTLDAQGQGRVIVIDRAGATVEGFTITGGAGYYSGGGVKVERGAGVILRHNQIVGNSAEGDGGAAFISHSSVQIVDNQIVQNTGTWSAGLRIINDTDAAVVGNQIRGNVAQATGGGIDVACCGGTTPLIARNVIVNNDAGAGGGGIRVVSTNARVVNNVVAGNQGYRGDGILLAGSASHPASVTLVHNTLVGQGTGDEGVRAEPNATAHLVNNIVVGFTAGITNSAPASATVTADHTLFDGNGTDYGPGVSSTDSFTGPAAFVSPATGDYHITAASAAVDTGADAGVGVDLDNDPRYGVPDVGADEYWAPGALRRVYLPLIRASAYPSHRPQVEPQAGEYFPCNEGGDTGCINGVSNWLLMDRWFGYGGDGVIEVSGRIRNDSDVGYWTRVDGASYDAEGNLLTTSFDSWPFWGSALHIPAHGTQDLTFHLESDRAIELIRIQAACGSVMPPP